MYHPTLKKDTADNEKSSENSTRKSHGKNFFSPPKSKCMRVIAPYILPIVVTLLVAVILVFSLTGDKLYAAAIDGQIVGYVTEEAVMNNAISQLESTMSELLDEDYTFSYEVSYISATATNDKLILTEDTVYQALVPFAADQVSACYYLYVNGERIAAAATKDTLFTAIQNLIAAIREKTPDCTRVTVEDEIKISAGLAAHAELSSVEQLEKLLCGEDTAPLLRFRTEQTRTYIEDLIFNTQYTPDAKRYIGDDAIICEGKNGKQSVTATIVTVDGKEIERVITNREIITPAVDREIIQGTKLLPELLKASGIITNNTYFIYPTANPIISSGFGYRYLAVSSTSFHSGMDIAGLGNYRGEYNVKAGVVGTVIEATVREGDKDYTIVIEKEDKTKICFDKMKSLAVKVGQKVGEKTTLGKRRISILAAASGKVIFAEYNDAYGNQILIDHGNGLVTCYAHLSQIDVTVGQTVTQGEEIGMMGCTGVVTGLHVHFEVRKDGTRVDPAPYLYN